ncbi:MAG: hypothetical protein JSV27_08195 [Candidatus Bathyarchaeota archaeon]|nr:MAG: hypothetical protein JSV27_08195 [Candidatus Bathyarchaeota archaeon]
MRERFLDPFADWDSYHPTPELNRWRRTYEAAIEEAMQKQRALETMREMLEDDVYAFCDACDEMKCYGALYPICEPVMKKLLDTLK